MAVSRKVALQPLHPGARSVTATADYMGVSPSSVWRLLRTGELPRTRIGGRTMVRHADAEAFLARAAEPANIFG